VKREANSTSLTSVSDGVLSRNSDVSIGGEWYWAAVVVQS
jgi:hypothetical protein